MLYIDSALNELTHAVLMMLRVVITGSANGLAPN